MKAQCGRTLELNCLFLLVVTLLVALQLVLQKNQRELLLLELKERGGVEEGEEGGQNISPHEPLLSNSPSQDELHSFDSPQESVPGGVFLAAPVVPNIRKSFPKRKAPYVRKAKNRRRKKGKKWKARGGAGGGGGGGGGSMNKINNKKLKGKRNDKSKMKT